MKNLEDLEKFINSELTSKINNSFIKHNNIYLNIDHEELIDVISISPLLDGSTFFAIFITSFL